MTKLLYWLGAAAVFVFYGFSEHAVPATTKPTPSQATIGEIITAVDTELNYRSLYRNVTLDQMMMGNICIEAKHKECEAYR